ncbi:MAG TPA: hypothetical protein VGH08_03080 [Chthoniobacterales bacterium]|jgi:hypothetical protein
MPGRKKLLLALSSLLLALSLTSLFMPLIMERTIPVWLRFKASQSGLAITFSEIHAPFLRPMEIRDLKITRAGVGGAHLEFSAPNVEATLSFQALLDRSGKTHLLRSLQVTHARVLLRGRALESAGVIEWPALAALLPERFEISADEIRFEQPFSRMELRDAIISASSGTSGAIIVGSIAIRAPLLQKNFADIRGVTRWQDNHLTLGSLRLLDGLTIDSLMFDLSRLRAGRLGTELSVSAFAGHIRANVTTERSEKTRIWELAGTASGVSLARLATALGVTEPIRGSLRASKFTFRGDPRDALHATASIWTELTDFDWRERKADAIMLGAHYYGRTMQLQQLYIKQQRNELTLSGETIVGFDWLNPDFRGDIVASIKDLGQFAELFGATPAAFDGTVAIRGRVHARERNIDGELAVTGDDLKIFHKPVDSLTARVGLDLNQVRLDQLELKRNKDFLRADGRIDFARNQAHGLSAELSCRELADYAVELPLLGKLAGSFNGKLDVSGEGVQSGVNLSAETNEFTISAAAQRQNQSLTIEHLDIAHGDLRAEFKGEATLTDARKIRLSLSPTNELRLDLPEDYSTCIQGVVFNRNEAGTSFSRIVIDKNDFVVDTQKLKLCGKNEVGTPLSISLPLPSPSPATTPPPTPSPQPPPSESPKATAPASAGVQR